MKKAPKYIETFDIVLKRGGMYLHDGRILKYSKVANGQWIFRTIDANKIIRLTFEQVKSLTIS